MDIARLASLIAATLTTGLMAGLFFAFDVAMMPALNRSDDRTLIQVMQRVNVAIINGWFLLGFLGALLFTGLALALHVASDGGDVVPPLAGALGAYFLALLVTARVSIPLNNALDQAGPIEHIADPAAVRQAFETHWVSANRWRTLLCTVALGCLAWALVRNGGLA
ncbi:MULTISPECIES: anthrone oxygenase family protein [unclassified Streptomyces]|uniref:anthrone oxygenase family protein n=1 Tax=unclassified Streptomyces TaxID=2593676 RepID=UPI0027E4E239|nr:MULTISPECIES: anthrone oxygenase family protein [unclassified Streptomyces]